MELIMAEKVVVIAKVVKVMGLTPCGGNKPKAYKLKPLGKVRLNREFPA
jgi:hypothetical protein